LSFENFDGSVDISRVWKNISNSIKTSARDSLDDYKLNTLTQSDKFLCCGGTCCTLLLHHGITVTCPVF